MLLNVNGTEIIDEIQAFKEKHAFAFSTPGAEALTESTAPVTQRGSARVVDGVLAETEPAPLPELPDDGEVPEEILECFLLEPKNTCKALPSAYWGWRGPRIPKRSISCSAKCTP